MPAGPEGSGPMPGGVGVAPPPIEGGLGAGASPMGRMEGLGVSPPPEIGAIKPPEIGNIGIGEAAPKITPEAAGLAAKLDATLGAPDIGIKEVARAGVPNVPDVGKTAVEAPTPGAEGQLPPKPEEAQVKKPQQEAVVSTQPPTEEKKVEGQKPEGEKPQEGGAKAEQPPQAEGQGTATKPTAGETEKVAADEKDARPPEDTDKAKRTQELEEKVKNRTATADEIKELRNLKQDPEQRRKDLEQRAIDGAITDQEAEELGKLNSAENTEKLTPEQQMEKLQKDIDELGTELMEKMANGEEVTKEDLEKLRNLRTQESLMNNGFTSEQAKSLGQVAERMRGKWSERQTQAAKEVQAEIQELMALELYLLSIPKIVEQLRAQAKALKEKAQAKHKEADSARGTDRLRKKQEEYTTYLQLLNTKSAIVAQKHMAPRIEARRQDLEQAVRRKLGVSHGLGALVEWGAAKTRNIVTGLGVGIEEEADFRSGNN